MLNLVWSTPFKRGVKHMKKRGKDMSKLHRPVPALIQQLPLPDSQRDHLLQGVWKGYRELHIEPDWLVIHRVEGSERQMARTGSLSDLFK